MSTPFSFANDQKATATGMFDMGGSTWGMGSGEWVVNVPTSSGAGLSLQGGAASGLGLAALGVAAGAVLLFLMRKKG